MRHLNQGRKLGRTSAHRIALLRNLAAALFEHGKIRTTLPKAKELTRFAHRLITLARKGTIAHRRQAAGLLPHKIAIQKLFRDIAPQFVGRNGGYTRIVRLPQHRLGDNAETCYLQLILENTPIPRRRAGWARNQKRNKRRFKTEEQPRAKGKAEAANIEPPPEAEKTALQEQESPPKPPAPPSSNLPEKS